ncbi:MAG: amidohydrolase family protein [Gemmatimonadales bacterium]
MTARLPLPAAFLGFALSLLLTATSHAQGPAAADSAAPVALVGVTVIDGTGRPAVPRQTVLVQGERIVAIFPTGSRPLSPEVTTLDLTGRFLIPGLIDTHVHLATDPSGEDSRPRAERRLRKALLGGITAVRDMAGDVRSLASLKRDALLAEIPSPDIYYSALFAGPAFFADPRTHDATRGTIAGGEPWMRAITDTTDIHQAVAEARGTGATAIKLYADLSGELARRVTVEAHAQHMPVWAHAALRPATPMEVVNAGVDVVSHASLVARAMDSTHRATALHTSADAALNLNDTGLDAVFRAMLQHHTVFEPTLLVFADDPATLRLAGAITSRAHQLGVTIIAGSDTLGDADTDSLTLPSLHSELELLVQLGGLTPAEALASATRLAAAVLGAQESRGTIEVGKLADLVVLSADPRTDIRNTRTIQLVVKRGRVYRRE